MLWGTDACEGCGFTKVKLLGAEGAAGADDWGVVNEKAEPLVLLPALNENVGWAGGLAGWAVDAAEGVTGLGLTKENGVAPEEALDATAGLVNENEAGPVVDAIGVLLAGLPNNPVLVVPNAGGAVVLAAVNENPDDAGWVTENAEDDDGVPKLPNPELPKELAAEVAVDVGCCAGVKLNGFWAGVAAGWTVAAGVEAGAAGLATGITGWTATLTFPAWGGIRIKMLSWAKRIHRRIH